MEFEKRTLCEIEKCYAVLGVSAGDDPILFYAGEGNGSLRAFHGNDFAVCNTIWEGGGGTMSIVPVRGYTGWAFASRGFYSMVESADSTIEIVRYDGHAFTHEPIARLPYLHRFGVLRAEDGTDYLLAASIASYKENKEDWSHPGHLYYAALPKSLTASFSLSFQQLDGDYFVNHGFCAGSYRGCEAAFIGCQNGAFAVAPPSRTGGEWTIERLFDGPVSDLAVSDIDGDGLDEIAVLRPFHGNCCELLKNRGTGWESVYTYPVENDFYHAVLSAEIGPRRVFVVGARKLSAQLFLLGWDEATNSVRVQVLAEGAGPSNVAVLNLPGQDLLLSADRMVGKATLFVFPKAGN